VPALFCREVRFISLAQQYCFDVHLANLVKATLQVKVALYLRHLERGSN